jgi:hypothetical protein
MDWEDIYLEQQKICKKNGLDWNPVDREMMVAINNSLLKITNPINGLRHPEQGKIDGWYLWSGLEIPQENNNFFSPVCVDHLVDMKPIVLKYLGLPPGWRFQIDDQGYEDVWFDKTLLDI